MSYSCKLRDLTELTKSLYSLELRKKEPAGNISEAPEDAQPEAAVLKSFLC